MDRCSKKHETAGEMLVYSASDFEDFLEPRPELASSMEDELYKVVRLLVEHRWPYRLHATYDESIDRFLKVFERVNRDVPYDGLRWFFDHAETVTPRNLERIKALGGGIAIQHRMAFQGEYFMHRYGARAAEETPPIRRMMSMGIPVGAGTDATRVASYNPFVSLYRLVTGKTVGGTSLYPELNRMSRMEALRLYTVALVQLLGPCPWKRGGFHRIQNAAAARLEVRRFRYRTAEIDLETVEPAHRKFLTAPDVIASGFEDFKVYLAKKLTVLAQQRDRKPAKSGDQDKPAVGRGCHPFAPAGPSLGSGFPMGPGATHQLL